MDQLLISAHLLTAGQIKADGEYVDATVRSQIVTDLRISKRHLWIGVKVE